MGLKRHSSHIKIGIADPLGAALYSYYTTGEFHSEGSSITEGIGRVVSRPISTGSSPTSPIKFPMKRLCRSCSI